MPTLTKRMGVVLVLACALCSTATAGGDSDAGTYAADLPSASGCGRRVLLELFADDTYVFVQRHLCRPWSPAQMETGSWMRDPGEILLQAAGRETRFAVEDRGLRYVGDRFGSAGLGLNRLD